MKIVFYETKSGRNKVLDFISKLSNQDQARIFGSLKSVEEQGLDSNRVQFRQINGKLWEIKIKTQTSGYRFFYVCLNSFKLVLLHAYKKQSQKAPAKELELAERRMKEVFENESYYR
jgi:phage-related protein